MYDIFLIQIGKSAFRVFSIEFCTGCEAQKIWMLIRHGTRNPSDTFIEKFNTRLPEIRDLILEHNSEDDKGNSQALIKLFVVLL